MSNETKKTNTSTSNKRLTVFTIKELREGSETKKLWVKIGSAWTNRDGSLNVYLDALPLDGKLHIREANEAKQDAEQAQNHAQAAA